MSFKKISTRGKMTCRALNLVYLLGTGFLISESLGCENESECPQGYGCYNSDCFCKNNTGGTSCSQVCSPPCDEGFACIGNDVCQECWKCPEYTSTCLSTGLSAHCKCKNGYGGTYCDKCNTDEGCSGVGLCSPDGTCTCPDQNNLGAFCESKASDVKQCVNDDGCNSGFCLFGSLSDGSKGRGTCYCFLGWAGMSVDLSIQQSQFSETCGETYVTSTTSDVTTTTSDVTTTTSDVTTTTFDVTTTTSDVTTTTSDVTTADASTDKCNPGDRLPFNCYQYVECQVDKWVLVAGCNANTGPFNNVTGECDLSCVCRNVSCTMGCTADQCNQGKPGSLAKEYLFLGNVKNIQI